MAGLEPVARRVIVHPANPIGVKQEIRHSMSSDTTHSLFQLLQRLDAGRYHYTLSRHRPDSVLVTVTFVGERTEIDVFEGGHMEVSRFLGTEDVLGGAELVWQLIRNNEQRDRKPADGNSE